MALSIRILQVDVPERDFDRTLAFWAGALSATPEAAPGAYTHLVGATSAVAVHLQLIEEGEPRYHLDLEADDVDAEADRLVELGATRVGWQTLDEDSGWGWWVLEDPARLPLCVVPDSLDPTPLAPRRPDTGYLDAVFVDVPVDVLDTEIAFWSAALGAPVAPSNDPDSPYTALDGVHGPGGHLYAEVQRVGAEPRYHVDLVATDVAREAQRLEAIGARRVAEIDTWITLADPAGNLLCVVPDTDER